MIYIDFILRSKKGGFLFPMMFVLVGVQVTVIEVGRSKRQVIGTSGLEKFSKKKGKEKWNDV